MSDKHAFPNMGEYGLTKREWFAGMALAGPCSDVSDFAKAAEYAFAFADAMIAESERTGK